MKKILLSILLSAFNFGGFSLAAEGPNSQLVVVHSKGENWPGNISFDDPQIQEHGKYWSSQSIVEKGGPMPGTGGGMMLLKSGTSMEEAQKIAAEDPAVKSKLLKADVRQWILFINNNRAPATKKNSAKASAVF